MGSGANVIIDERIRSKFSAALRAAPNAAAIAESPAGKRLLLLPSTHDREHISAILEWRRERGY